MREFAPVEAGGGGFRDVDGPAHDFGTRFGQLDSLLESGGEIGGVRIGHEVHDDGSDATHADVADVYKSNCEDLKALLALAGE